ncbi:MAG: DUF2232 domain-containing protein [Candidatus Carbobacillus sp.]|nr:DUF2232 domain-containing protein [Candidatus Carbobacillus sp.]
MENPMRHYSVAVFLGMIYIVALMITIKTPLILLYPLLLPAPFFIEGFFGRQRTRTVFLAFAFVVSILFFGWGSLFLTFYALLSGYGLAYLIQKTLGPLESLGLLFLWLLILNVVFLFGSLQLAGIQLQSWIDTLVAPLEHNVDMFWPEGSTTFQLFVSTLIIYMPYMLTLYSFLQAILLYVLYERLSRRFRSRHKPLPSIATLSFPRWLLWLYFLFALLTYTGDPPISPSLDRRVIVNMFLITSTMLMLQGMFFIYRWSKEKGSRMVWRMLALIALVLPPFDLILRLLGLYDLLMRQVKKTT